jgi:hypothetical protein
MPSTALPGPSGSLQVGQSGRGPWVCGSCSGAMPRSDLTVLRLAGWSMFALSQLVLAGVLAATRNLLIVALLETFILLILMVAVTMARYHRYRKAYEQRLGEAAVSLERVRLAEDLHDMLGAPDCWECLRRATPPGTQLHCENR